jgi:hypothetical protein
VPAPGRVVALPRPGGIDRDLNPVTGGNERRHVGPDRSPGHGEGHRAGEQPPRSSGSRHAPSLPAGILRSKGFLLPWPALGLMVEFADGMGEAEFRFVIRHRSDAGAPAYEMPFRYASRDPTMVLGMVQMFGPVRFTRLGSYVAEILHEGVPLASRSLIIDPKGRHP